MALALARAASAARATEVRPQLNRRLAAAAQEVAGQQWRRRQQQQQPDAGLPQTPPSLLSMLPLLLSAPLLPLLLSAPLLLLLLPARPPRSMRAPTRATPALSPLPSRRAPRSLSRGDGTALLPLRCNGWALTHSSLLVCSSFCSFSSFLLLRLPPLLLLYLSSLSLACMRPLCSCIPQRPPRPSHTLTPTPQLGATPGLGPCHRTPPLRARRQGPYTGPRPARASSWHTGWRTPMGGEGPPRAAYARHTRGIRAAYARLPSPRSRIAVIACPRIRSHITRV